MNNPAQKVQLPLSVIPGSLCGVYQHLYDNYQFENKLKSFCIWGRLNISFFTFATLKIRHFHPTSNKKGS
jgi:hypothetical protein